MNFSILTKDRMKLYQHSVRCPVAMQIFLDANPRYWRFVPMTLEESEVPEQQLFQDPDISDEISFNLRLKHDCQLHVTSIPKPPQGYTFSKRQIALQMEYFHKMQDKILPNQDIDLYNATVVAVLPETCTEMFRFTIESLFITYAETKLNTIGNVLNPTPLPDSNPWLIRGSDWCQGLLRRPHPKKISFNENN